MAEQKNEQKKYVEPNRYAGYDAAMAPVAGDPMAVEWQARDGAKIAEATTPKALAAHVLDAASAEALLAKVQGAYKTDAVTLAVIGAVSQYVMDPAVSRADGDRRKIWNMALIGAFRKTKDEYIQTFMLDQLRWCGCACHEKDIRALADVAVSANVKAYIDWVAAEVAGSMIPAK